MPIVEGREYRFGDHDSVAVARRGDQGGMFVPKMDPSPSDGGAFYAPNGGEGVGRRSSWCIYYLLRCTVMRCRKVFRLSLRGGWKDGIGDGVSKIYHNAGGRAIAQSDGRNFSRTRDEQHAKSEKATDIWRLN